jgi:hypothetical protein
VRRLGNPASAPSLGLTPWRTWGCPTNCKIPLSRSPFGHYVASYAADCWWAFPSIHDDSRHLGDSGTALSLSNLYFFHVIHWQLGIPSAGDAVSACLGGAEVAAVREEGAAVSMPGMAGPRIVFTWQDRQTVQALGLSQSFRARPVFA